MKTNLRLILGYFGDPAKITQRKERNSSEAGLVQNLLGSETVSENLRVTK